MKNRAPLFGLLAVVVLSVGFYFLIWSPKSDEQAALQAETAELDTQVATLENELDRLLDIQENEFEYRTQLSKLEEYIPGDPAQPVALKQFQEAADLAGVTITSMTNGEPTLVEGAPPAEDPELALAKIDVAMTVEGGYFQHVDLLRRLEVDTPRALLVRNVSLAEGEDGFPDLSATWSGEMFAVVPIEAAAPAATEPADGATPAPADGDAPQAGATPAPAEEAVQAAADTTESTS